MKLVAVVSHAKTFADRIEVTVEFRDAATRELAKLPNGAPNPNDYRFPIEADRSLVLRKLRDHADSFEKEAIEVAASEVAKEFIGLEA